MFGCSNTEDRNTQLCVCWDGELNIFSPVPCTSWDVHIMGSREEYTAFSFWASSQWLQDFFFPFLLWFSFFFFLRNCLSPSHWSGIIFPWLHCQDKLHLRMDHHKSCILNILTKVEKRYLAIPFSFGIRTGNFFIPMHIPLLAWSAHLCLFCCYNLLCEEILSCEER